MSNTGSQLYCRIIVNLQFHTQPTEQGMGLGFALELKIYSSQRNASVKAICPESGTE